VPGGWGGGRRRREGKGKRKKNLAALGVGVGRSVPEHPCISTPLSPCADGRSIFFFSACTLELMRWRKGALGLVSIRPAVWTVRSRRSRRRRGKFRNGRWNAGMPLEHIFVSLFISVAAPAGSSPAHATYTTPPARWFKKFFEPSAVTVALAPVFIDSIPDVIIGPCLSMLPPRSHVKKSEGRIDDSILLSIICSLYGILQA